MADRIRENKTKRQLEPIPFIKLVPEPEAKSRGYDKTTGRFTRTVNRILSDGTTATHTYQGYREQFLFNDIRYSVTAQTRAKLKIVVEEKKEKLLKLLNDSKVVKHPYADETFSSMTQAFYQWGNVLADSTQKRRKSIWSYWVLPRLGNDIVMNTNSTQLDLFFTSLRDEAGPKQALEVHKLMNIFFTWNIEHKLALSVNPISIGIAKSLKAAVTTLILKHPKETIIYEEHVKRVMEYVRGTPEEPVYMLQTYHGLRISEALAMDWKNVDLHRNVIYVRQQVTDNGIKEDLKSHNPREVPLERKFKDWLLKTPECERVGLLFTDAKNLPLNRTRWRRKHLRLLFKLGLVSHPEEIGGVGDSSLAYTHAFRKYYTSVHLREDKSNITLISKRLVHKNQSTTLDIYNSIVLEKEDEQTQPSTTMDFLVDKLPEDMTDYDYIDWNDALTPEQSVLVADAQARAKKIDQSNRIKR